MRAISRQKRRRRKTLFVESLEPRIVLDGQLAEVVADPPNEPNPVPAIERFESADELRGFLVDSAVQQWGGLFGQPASPWRFHPVYLGAGPLDPAAVSPAIAEFSIAGFDGTNVQVRGVDEGDLVKTDGQYIYVAANGELSIIDARNPTELTLVSQFDVGYGLRDLYVTADRLTTISTSFNAVPLGASALTDAVIPFEPGEPETIVTVYDVSDRSSPGWISDTRIDGTLVSSRRIDDLVYLVTNQNMAFPRVEFSCDDEHAGDGTGGLLAPSSLLAEDEFYPLPLYPFPEPQQTCVYETEQAYIARVSDTIVETVLPSYHVTQEAQVEIGGLLSAPEEVYKPTADDVHNLSSITVMDVNASTDGIVSTVTVPTNYSTTIYASAESIYLAARQWSEGGSKTQLQQFAISEAGHVELAAIGSVDGTLLNQFSLDEHDGNLRIVTTAGWGSDTRNRLYVLGANDQQLEVVGKIDSIAPGERVFAARFLDDEAFVVTFRQIDPLFTIDLSDPTNPTVEGELEIPGFSNYLHPITEDLVIGLGQEGANWGSSPQLSLFDVSDFSAPQRIDKHSFKSGGWTEASYNHHAFSYFEDSQILVIPFTAGSGFCIDFCTPQQSGAFWILKVDANSEDPLRVLGSIEHDSHALRSLRIGDTLFTVSTKSVKATALENPDTLLDQLGIGRTAVRDRFVVDLASQGDVLDVLQNDQGTSNTIIEVSVPTNDASVAISEDGQSIVYTPPAGDLAKFDTFTYTIDNGARTDTATVHISLSHDSARETMTQLATADLAELLQVDPDEIEFRQGHRETWPDSCLGIESPEEECAAVLTAGFRINLATDGGRFLYRTNTVDRVALVSAYLKLQSDHFEVTAGGATALDVLANDGSHSDRLRIIHVAGADGEVTIAEDGKSLSYTPANSGLATASFTYTVELADGVTDTSQVSIIVLGDAAEEIEQAAVAALSSELNVDAESIAIVATEVLPDHNHCLSSQAVDCGYTVRVGLQHENRFYVYHALSAAELQLNRVFEPQLRDDRAQVETGGSVVIRVLSDDHLRDSTFPQLHADPTVITAVSDSREGATISFDDTTVHYTPPDDFVGEDVFTYSVGDLQAEVHVLVEGFPGHESLVGVRPEVVDANGNVVSMLHPGDEAVLQIYVEDLRDDPRRVFSAFVDVEFDPAMVAEIVAIEYGSGFDSIRTGDTETPGLIDELGAVDFDLEGTVQGEQLLASVTFLAGDAGTLTFATAAADLFPNHDTLLLGVDNAVPLARVEYGATTVEIDAGMHNTAMAEDTNGDGEVSPSDALQVINFLNESGPQAVALVMAERAAQGFAANADGGQVIRSYLDVNNDGHISPLDALLCINRIREKLAGVGEGESRAPAQHPSSPTLAGVIGLEADRLDSGPDRASTIEAIAKARLEAAGADRPDTTVWTATTARTKAEAHEASVAADEVFAELRIANDGEQVEWWLG